MALLIPLLILVGLGALAALGLGLASRKFAVAVDPRVETLEGDLPGINCGACGYAGCSALARALAAGEAEPTACIPGGAAVAAALAQILGVEAGESLSRVAVVHCKGTHAVAADKGVYQGLGDCRAAYLVGGGPKLCNYGCVGLGSCERSCLFDAIHVGADGISHVDRELCTGCGACVEACPKNLIELVPSDVLVPVRCSSPLKGKAVSAVCTAGCIGCGKCQKTCPFEAIQMERGLARIDPQLCTSCGLCVPVCPTGNIDDLVEVRYRAAIDPDVCTGCGRCLEACPVEAIEGVPDKSHRVLTKRCISCYRCLAVCPVQAVSKVDPYRRGAGEEAA